MGGGAIFACSIGASGADSSLTRAAMGRKF